MISALWEDIGFGEPFWSDRGAALLHLAPHTVELSLSEDGRYVLVAINVAPLADEPGRRALEIDALLRLGLLSLTANRSGICIEEKGDLCIAVVRAMCLCETGLLHRLSDIVADAIHLSDECLRCLARRGAREQQHADAARSVPADSMIFRP